MSLLCAFLFFFRLADRELSSSHEARAAQNAQMILDEGDWALPRLFDGRVELQKPPLYYWLVALIGWLRGGVVDVPAVRLPAALAGWACVLSVWWLGRRCGRPRGGFVAAIILATSVHFTWLARVARIDLPLTLTMTLAMGGFALGSRRLAAGGAGWRRWFVMGYVAMAIGALFKGPIALTLPCVVAAVWLLLEWRRSGRFPRQELLTLAWGLPLVIAIAGPWFVWANVHTGNRLVEVFFWRHNVERGFGSLTAHPWWFYAARLPLDFLPWSLLLPFAAWWTWRRQRRLAGAELRSPGVPRENDLHPPGTPGLRSSAPATPSMGAFGLVWFLTVFALLSLMQFKRADYLLPAFPGLALWLGSVADDWWRSTGLLRRVTRWAVAVLTLACVAGWGLYATAVEPRHDASHTYRRLAEEIRRRTSLPVIFFRAEAHEVAFHVGRPLDTILEWENLEVWATQASAVYIVMPPECVAAVERELGPGKLYEVLRTTDLAPEPLERPLVLMRAPGRNRELPGK